jgi:Nucleoside-diphosphate-sugar epimerases
MEDVEAVASLSLPWEKLSGKTVLVTGATGMMGSCLIDAIMRKNEKDNLNCFVVAVGRSFEKAAARFSNWKVKDRKTLNLNDVNKDDNNIGSNEILFIEHDINNPISGDILGTPDYILHLASNTHPVAYATDPIGTITSNMLGIYYLLEYASSHSTERVLFASSNEIALPMNISPVGLLFNTPAFTLEVIVPFKTVILP